MFITAKRSVSRPPTGGLCQVGAHPNRVNMALLTEGGISLQRVYNIALLTAQPPIIDHTTRVARSTKCFASLATWKPFLISSSSASGQAQEKLLA